MSRKLSVMLNWDGDADVRATLERTRLADDAGIHAIWAAETWGHDVFSLLTLLAEHTKRIQIGTYIVNCFSRTPAALAQHWGTLDWLSGGRMNIGLGTSSPNVTEHFHGMKFSPPVTRMSECIDIINMLIARKPLNYEGKLFKMSRGFTLRFEPVRKHIPIFLGSMNPKMLQLTAQKADGWFPVMVPLSHTKRAVDDFRVMVAAAGRDPMSVSILAASQVIITDDPQRARQAEANFFSFYVGRMGNFYADQFTRLGYGEEVRKIKEAWAARDAKAAAAAVSRRIIDDMCYAGGVEGARERLAAQEEAGVDIHAVQIRVEPADYERTVKALLD
jgi:alkanesulfonate monooxygenase SsuD/methylene tetrahydromethanopterin reductase-like flavin-dependent oxidoreductase (luciferase family)